MDSKAMARGIAAVVILICTLLGGATAEGFEVGDVRGWIVPYSGLNYTVWAQNITAHVGDSLYFKYNPNAHNVLKVDAITYATCNRTAPHLQIWDNGDTTVMLEEAGIHYFFCGAPDHCVLGQAFALEVLPVPSDMTPSGPNILSPPSQHGSGASFVSVPHYWLLVLASVVFFLNSS